MSTASLPTAVHVRAPGKINVFLSVGARHDDGYHALATVFQAVSLYEEVIAWAADDVTVSISGEMADASIPRDDRNLAVRAAKLLAAATGYEGGVRLDIRKRVPVAGGMGGGSADAAATLVACDALWGTGLSASRLHELAARLGADVPFALHGGTAVGTGRGDQLTPALAPGRFDWVLVTSPIGLSTPAIYARLDDERSVQGALADDPPDTLDVPAGVLHALRSGDPYALAAVLHNDLQVPALGEHPDLDDVLSAGIDSGALAGIVSGSGPTVALLCADDEAADEVVEQLQAQGRHAMHVYSAVPGARIVG